MADNENQPGMDWSARGAHWNKTAPDGVSVNDEPNQLLIRLANIQPGDHVLDLASGAGEPAISIALAVGDAGRVTALDANAEMLAGARRRAAKLALSNMKFEIGRMEELTFDGEVFDAVTCRFGLMQADDAQGAVTEARRVLKRGKRAAWMVHGPMANNTLYPVLRAAVFDFLDEEDTEKGRRRFRFSGEGELEQLLTGAGFRDVAEKEVSNLIRKDRDDVFWAATLSRAFGAKLTALSEEKLDDLNGHIGAAFEPYLKGGHYELRSSERVVSGVA